MSAGATSICKNCSAEAVAKFCPQCGQKTNTQRITIKNILREIPESILQIEKGFPFTVKGLFTRPAGFLQDYFKGKRKSYYKPLGYVIILSTLSSLITYLVDLYLKNQGMLRTVHEKPEGVNLLLYKSAVFFSQYSSVFYFLMVPFISLATFIFFNKKYNYWEHMISNIYLTAQFNFLLILAQVTRLFNQGHVSFTPFLIIFFTYLTLVYRKLFNPRSGPGEKISVWFPIKMVLVMIVVVMLYTTGLSLAGMMTPWWGK